MHLTLVLLVGTCLTNTLQQCPPPSSGGCPPATSTLNPVVSGCPTTASSQPTTGSPANPSTTTTPSGCPTTASSQPTTGSPTNPSTTTTPSGCPTTASSQPAAGCPTDPSTSTASSPTGGCPTATSGPGSQTTQCPCTGSGSEPSPGNGAGSDSCGYPAVCENAQGSADFPADSDSPYYDQVVSRSEYTQGQDNACTTLFNLGNGATLIVHTKVFTNGSYDVDITAVYGPTDSIGVYRGEGLFGASGLSTCVYNDVLLGSTKGECKDYYVFYRCHLFGDCVNKFIGADSSMTAYSLYNQYNISSQCKSELISFMKSQQLNSTDFVQMPNNLPHQCVIQIGGLKCYRADSVEPGTGITLP